MVGYVPGNGPLHRAHPLTSMMIVVAVAAAAFTVPGVWNVLLIALGLVFVFVEAVPTVLKTAVPLSLPFWVFLLLIHGILGDSWERGVMLAARITTMLLVFLVFLASVHPARLVEALVDKKVPFSIAFLLAATLQAVPELRDRATAVLEAQRCRGLRAGGSIANRVRVLLPLTIPLVMSSLTTLDERTVALETRGAASGVRRTPLNPPSDALPGRILRWFLLALIPTLIWLRMNIWSA
jgi:energy-coupling factor transport system permease protein